MKILGNFTDWAGYPERRKLNTFGGIGYYRMFKPSQCLTNHKVDLVGSDIDKFGTTLEGNYENIFENYDVFWAVHFFNEQLQVAQCYTAQKYKKLLIYDLDDNYLDLPESNPVYKNFFDKTKDGDVSSRRKSTLTAALSLADALTVSTEPLKERMQAHFKHAFKLEKPIYVIPNMNDLADFNFEPAPKHGDKVVIGYQGSTSHKEDLQMVLPAIQRLMKKYKHLHLEILGAIDKKDIDDYFGAWDMKLLERVGMWPSTRIFNEYPKWLSARRWDIGIAPLVDSAFTKSKSHIKWMEYASYKIPCVASRVYPYYMNLAGRKTIQDGTTGFLCQPLEWEKTLEKLILDKNMRERVGRQAYEAVKKDWQYRDSEIQATFDRILVECGKGKKLRK
jgi:glycosyltransferase involved in cell wall biosynthesis